MKQTGYKVCGLWLALTLAIFYGVGCGHYEAGSLMHPQIDTVFISPVENQTDVSGLGSQIRRFVASRLMRDGSVKISSREKADAILSLRLKNYATSEAGSAKIRDEELIDDEDEDEEYQTSVYEANMDVEMRLSVPGREEPVLDWQTVSGDALYSRLPDMVQTRRAGLRQAASHTAENIVTRFTEAW